MAKFIIPVYWEMFGVIKVEAETLIDAIKEAKTNLGNYDSNIGEYVDDSFRLTDDIDNLEAMELYQ